MNRLSRLVPALFLAGALAGCATTGPASSGASIGGGVDPQRPMSELPVTTPAQRSAKVHVELGSAYMESGRNGVALDEARAALAADPAYAPAQLLMGQVYAQLEQFALAAPAFQEAARLAPGDPEVNNAYGWFLCSQGREAEGVARLEQAARNPYFSTPTRAWTNAGQCKRRVKDLAGAETYFLRAVQADPSNAQAAIYLADVYFSTGRDLAAKKWVDEAQKYMRRSNPSVLWLAARIERKLGNDATANDYGARLRKEFPEAPEYQKYLQGRFE